MTTFRDDFERSSLGNNYASTHTWSIVDGGVRCEANPAYSFLFLSFGNHASVTAVHAENQLSGKIGVVARHQYGSSWVRLVCDPSNGWTWTLEESLGYIYVGGQYVLQTEIRGEWDNQGPPAGRRTTLVTKGPIFDAYLDGVHLGRWVDTSLRNMVRSEWGLTTSNCTARISELQVTRPDVESYMDSFDRDDLGTTYANGSAYINADDWETFWEPPQVGYVKAKVVGDNQLVFDAKPEAYRISVRILAENFSNDIGLIVRWVDEENYIALTARSDDNKLELVKFEEGARASLWEGIYVDQTYNRTMTLELNEDWISIDWDFQYREAVETSFNQGATIAGIWAGNQIGAFDGVSVTSGIWPAAVLEPAEIEIATGDIELSTSLQPGKFRVHGGNLIYYIPPTLDTGIIEVAGSDLALSTKLQPGHIVDSGSEIAVIIPPLLDGGLNNPSPTGQGRLPIGGLPAAAIDGITDENGNVLVDENGNVLIFE